MSEDDDKQHDPSQRRLDEARKRGDLPRSQDISTAAAYGGVTLAVALGGMGMLQGLGQVGQSLLDRADLLAPEFANAARPGLGNLMRELAIAFAPIFLVPMVSVTLALSAQRAFVFAPQKLAPKLSRLSPLTNAAHKFGRDGLFEFAKNFLKMLTIGVLVGLYIAQWSEEIVASLDMSVTQSTQLMLQILIGFLFLVFLFSAAMGGLDYLWVYTQHRRRNRMSRQELTDEMKESEGDPHIKGQRRQRAQDIALNHMLQDVATADVVIVNPTHYAVALRWKRTDRTAPVCVAKGVDEIAMRIRERAALSGIPLHSDPPTARSLYALVELGQPILPDHYKSVAAAIRFAEALRKRRATRR